MEGVNQSCKYVMWRLQGPLAEICPALWTIGLRRKVNGLEALQDHYEGPFANLLFILILNFDALKLKVTMI